jgi:hypothetical protein
MASEMLEITVRYACDLCSDEWTVDYGDLDDVETSPEHEDCPGICETCSCECEDCPCEDEECGECGCGEAEEEEEDEDE